MVPVAVDLQAGQHQHRSMRHSDQASSRVHHQPGPSIAPLAAHSRQLKPFSLRVSHAIARRYDLISLSSPRLPTILGVQEVAAQQGNVGVKCRSLVRISCRTLRQTVRQPVTLIRHASLPFVHGFAHGVSVLLCVCTEGSAARLECQWMRRKARHGPLTRPCCTPS